MAKYLHFSYTVRQRLRQAIEEMDRDDPGWRLEDIEAARAVVPDAENGALRVMAAARLLDQRQLEGLEDIPRAPINVRLSKEQVELLKVRFVDLRASLAEARQLAGCKTGRYPIEFQRVVMKTRLPNLQKIPLVLQLLYLDTFLRLEESDMAGAVASCRAVINTGRSVGDDPFAIVQLIRIAGVEVGCRAVERVLGQTQPEEKALLVLQQLLENEAAFPRLEVLVRGERASLHATLEALEDGVTTFSEITDKEPSWSERALGFFARDRVREAHPELFSLTNWQLNIVRMPPHLRGAAEDEWDAWVRESGNGMIPMLFPAVQRLERSDRRLLARLRCTTAALAAERYRRKNGVWPDPLVALQGLLSPSTLTDPCDGEPLRSERLPDGMLIYSVGTDGQDNGGNLEGPFDTPGTDIGVRLWNPAKRFQPAPAQ